MFPILFTSTIAIILLLAGTSSSKSSKLESNQSCADRVITREISRKSSNCYQYTQICPPPAREGAYRLPYCLTLQPIVRDNNKNSSQALPPFSTPLSENTGQNYNLFMTLKSYSSQLLMKPKIMLNYYVELPFFSYWSTQLE